MMNVVVYERGSYSKSEASVSGCFACGGCLSVRTGDFLRCMSCCAENYCPLTTAPAEERVRQWFHRRGCIARREVPTSMPAERAERASAKSEAVVF